MAHGFLVLRAGDSTLLATGDLLQQAVGRDSVQSRMVFKFKDGSLLDETVIYTQRGVFAVQTYHLIQTGPAFKQDIDARMERAGATYRVATKDHKNGKESVREGAIDLPADVANGIVMLMVKNLPKGAFARFEGPLAMDGPVWRIDTTAPRWPEAGR